MPVITCPSCGFSKDLPDTSLPRQGARITCPKCRTGFICSRAPTPAGPAFLPVTCPHCGQASRLSAEQVPPESQGLRCRHCGQTFRFHRAGPAVHADAPPSGPGSGETSPERARSGASADARPTELPPVIDLFERSWQSYRQQVWTILGIYLLTLALPGVGLALLLGGAAAASTIIQAPGPGLLIGLALIGLAALAGLLLVMNCGLAATVMAVVRPELSLVAALKEGWRLLWAFAWLYFLLTLLVAGGFLLLGVPGVLFMTWFLFAQYVLAEEDLRGMEALHKSREYVRGYFWSILLRLLVLYVSIFLLYLLLGWIPLLGGLLQVAAFPFTLIYPYLVFSDIKRVQGEVVVYPDWRVRAAWLATGLLGYLVLPLAFWLADGPEVVRDYLQLFETSRRGVQTAPGWPADRGRAPIEQLGKEAPRVETLAAADYQGLLARHFSAPGGGAVLGPLALAFDRFWSGGPAPHQWLEIRCLDLPNLGLMGERAIRIDIERVADGEGRDLYAADNMFEKEVFRRIRLQPDVTGRTWSGHRDVYLLDGTREEDVAEIRGTLHLDLPLGIQVLELTPSMMGESFQVAGQRVRFVTLRGGAAQLAFPGGPGRLLRVVGYNDSGQPLAEVGSSWSETPSGTALTQRFQGELYSLKVIMARKMFPTSYPFVLNAATGRRG